VLALLARMEIQADETLVVGDTTFDIEMGNRAGCKTCAVTWGNHSCELLQSARPDMIIDDLDSIYHELSQQK
jgi:phosphoglycolate phosphatase